LTKLETNNENVQEHKQSHVETSLQEDGAQYQTDSHTNLASQKKRLPSEEHHWENSEEGSSKVCKANYVSTNCGGNGELTI
jgi:hypothetical protein